MIDKTLRKAKAERYGDLIVARMRGGYDCLWMNMYLDGATGQMLCDSDIGSYAYHWGRYSNKSQSWTDFCCEWLSNREWLLRKCIGERRAELKFDRETSAKELRRMFLQDNEERPDLDDLLWDLDCVIDIANGYDDRIAWSAAINTAAYGKHMELPEEWYECICERYTPWQLRFAEICKEVIVPAIRAMEQEG